MTYLAVIHLAVIHATALEVGKQFLSRREREVMQEDHDVLFVRGSILGGSHDQRCRQQILFLQRVRVHPVGSTVTDGEAIGPLLARLEQ